ncbi:MAG TPA: thiol peroxidase [Oligoflexia bacterium]|nr:thiol peroxidase [Oligoflexia bacterium]HMP47611.1 thiol peroxidase [Oligoflexia bacterium]
MAETNQKITLHGNPIEVSGKSLKVGDKLPDFLLSNQDLKDSKLSDYSGKILVLSVVPSIDTPVCQVQTRRFNEEAIKLSDKVAILTISRDLPFAQKRWCGAEGIERIECLSDYKYRSFGKSYGADIENIGLLARAIFIADSSQVLRYVDYVDEISHEPDYDSVIRVIKDCLEE